MKNDELMELNIQLFAEEADNDVEDEVLDESTEADTDTDVADGEEDSVDYDNINYDDEEDENKEEESAEEETEEDDFDKKINTKKYSDRLNEERKKIREEEQERIRQEKEDEQKVKLDAVAKSKGFDSWEELEDYSEQEKLNKLGIVDQDEFKSYIDDVISNSPEVKKAKEILEAQENERKQSYLKKEITEINKFDKSIKTIDDLAKIDRYDDFITRVNKGVDLSDAYKLTYFDVIKSNSEEIKLKQKQLNMQSKSHLKSTSGGAAKAINVPSEIMDGYRKNLPNWSDDQIRKHYAKEKGIE